MATAVRFRRLTVTALVAVGASAALAWRTTAHGRGPVVPTTVTRQADDRALPPARWCATPQPEDPLLQDARDVLGRRGTLGDAAWFHGVVGAGDELVVIVDEQVCREAARAYGGGSSGTVLVVQVGDIYLVDDQRPRQGAGAFWHVHVLDAQLKPTIFAYGGGA